LLRFLLIGFLVAGLGAAVAQPQTDVWPVETFEIGSLPAGWAVPGKEEDAPDWHLIQNPDAPDGKPVLAMLRPAKTGLFGWFGSGFNVVIDPSADFLNGTISVHFKSVSGSSDQGGGIMWRVQDAENYYVARFNPLEDNFRFYTVRNGSRSELASARMKLDPQSWHKMTISQSGATFRGYLDGKLLLEYADGTFSAPGGVGLWTKSDAVTLFDDFRIDKAP